MVEVQTSPLNWPNVCFGSKEDVRVNTASARKQPMKRSAAVGHAFSLARSGQCRSVAEVITRLMNKIERL